MFYFLNNTWQLCPGRGLAISEDIEYNQKLQLNTEFVVE